MLGEIQPRDPRIDQAVSWTLTTAAALAFGMGAWQFQGLSTKVAELQGQISTLLTRISVVEAVYTVGRIEKIEERVRIVEIGQLREPRDQKQ